MMKRISAALIAISLAALNAVTVTAEPQEMKITGYCPESCGGQITASGAHVRHGIAASTRDHLGDCAMIYTVDGEFIGYYECLDVGGTQAIRDGYVIDIWEPDLDAVYELMEETDGKVLVDFIDDVKG